MQDITRVSHAMDVLAKSILEKQRVQQGPKEEYGRKLEQLKLVLDAVLKLQKDQSLGRCELDTVELDSSLEKGLQTVERDGRKYVLVPVTETANNVEEATPDKKPRKKKKNKILCSFCHEKGHTRASCQKRLSSVDFRGNREQDPM